MKRDRFLANEIMCEIYWDNNISNNRTAIYQYGFPGSNGKNVLISYLTELGFTVIAPHFPGTFDSGGSLTPINTYEFYKNIYEIIRKGDILSLKKNKALHIQIGKIEFAFGHSYGCWSILRGGAFLKDLKYMFLLGPAITYAESKYDTNCGLIEEGKEHIEMVLRTRPYTYRINELETFEKLYKGEYDNFEIKETSIKKIVGVVGTDDPYFEIEKLVKRFPEIIGKSIKMKVEQKLLVVKGGTHGLESLMLSDFKKELDLCL